MSTPMQKRKLIAEINVVPYIDVMLVLLIIFMVTAPLLTAGMAANSRKPARSPSKTFRITRLSFSVSMQRAICTSTSATTKTCRPTPKK